MLVAQHLDGSIMDMANSAALNLTSQAGAPSPSAPVPGSSVTAASESGFLADILAAAKAKADADKRKATWILVGVGAGALVLGLLIGRYAVPARKKRKG